MEKLVDELQQVVPFKESTDIGDIVLIVAKEPQMLVYALVTDITRDTTRKDEWWHLALTFLTVPPQEITWTLRTAQMTGKEIFTMGGEERFVKAVNLTPAIAPEPVLDEPPTAKKSKVPAAGSFLKRVK
ncbi:hypothetical protein JYT85_00480 [Desulfocapsa sp. AH-315-G09]|uniref:Uncharacterized protein n=1 Tax=Desulfotalea psychrophila TaxID=84980 RepID=A0ABS3AUK5_9BACT|nr:hypothetical protein [Desulfocapsa sp.]MBN4065107.1 hypothetical protein [Desulfocapsa sp. AH-315-G09]MBN4068780.1 hypothetical protein [Desulfotalea psychrophila]